MTPLRARSLDAAPSRLVRGFGCCCHGGDPRLSRLDDRHGARRRARSSRSIRGYLAAVLALVAVDRAVMILRWVLLLRASGVADHARRSAASIFLVSSFVGSFLPAGVGGDAARA